MIRFFTKDEVDLEYYALEQRLKSIKVTFEFLLDENSNSIRTRVYAPLYVRKEYILPTYYGIDYPKNKMRREILHKLASSYL